MLQALPSLALILTTLPTLTTQQSGSTLHLKDIFLGRCYDYKLNRVGKPLPDVSARCPGLWNLFEVSFAYKPSCGLERDSYQDFLDAGSQPMPTDESLFWSGTSDLVHRLSQEGLAYVTMEDTMIGYLADSLAWCGKETVPGIDYVSCPAWGSCDGDTSTVFWESSSKWFAEQARGQVFVLLDGSNPDSPAYRPDSFFATIELPNLDPQKVTTVNVMLVKRFDHPEDENCGTESLIKLQQDVEARRFSYSCEENPPHVLHLLCVDDANNAQCQQQCSMPQDWLNRLSQWNPFGSLF